MPAGSSPDYLVWVVGLARRTDRRRRIERFLDRASVPFEVLFSADLGLTVDWRNLATEDVRRAFRSWDIGGSNPWWNRSLRRGELACGLSHLNVWLAARATGRGAVILEDDAVLEPSFGSRSVEVLEAVTAVDPGWGLLYLGRERLAEDYPVPGSALVVPGYSYSTYGYCLSASGLDTLCESGFGDAIIPVDEFLPSTYCRHPRDDVRARYPPRLRAYAPAEDVVAGSGAPHDSDTENSPALPG